MAGNVYAAARRGDLRAVQRQVEELAADVNEPDVQRKTPLHYAAERGHMETVAYLIQQRADLEMRNGTGQTPLMSAAHRGQSEVIDLLLLNSADPNAVSDHGFLPLHRAAAAGHEDTVRVLLKGRANPLAIDGFMMESPMHLAAREGHADVVRTLMGAVPRPEVGLSAEQEAELGVDHTAILREAQDMMAKDPSHSKVIGVCGLKSESVDAGNSRGETALHLAAAHGHLECAHLLLQMSTKSWKTWWIDRKDGRSGDTALHRACHEGRSEVVRLLLDEKANPSLTNQLGRTPLHLAVNAGDDKIATYLLRAGASQVALDLDGRRPIAAGAGEWSQPPPEGIKLAYWNQNIQDTAAESAQKQHNASMVKMALSDVGTGLAGARQGFITKVRQDNATARRRAAWRMSAAGGFTEKDVLRGQQGMEARNARHKIRQYETERDNLEWRLRSAWAHGKIKQVWQAYRLKKEEERRERERQRRKEEADRIRQAQTLGAPKDPASDPSAT